MKNILFATSEAVPFIKTGGLADVAGALPKCFDKRYFDVRVILPKYACMKQEWKDKMEYITHFYMDLGYKNCYVGIMHMEYDGIQFYFIDNEYYFSGPKPYDSAPWDLEKFAFFSKAVLSVLPVINFRPDVIHCHDWQTGLVPVYLHDSFQQNEFFWGIKTVMTIHNLKFQGVWDVKTVRGITGLSDYYFAPDKLEAYKDANFLKGGIVFADAVTTMQRRSRHHSMESVWMDFSVRDLMISVVSLMELITMYSIRRQMPVSPRNTTQRTSAKKKSKTRSSSSEISDSMRIRMQCSLVSFPV